MSDKDALHAFEPIARRLRAEAMEERPEFSAALHARIVSRIQTQPGPAACEAPRRTRAARRLLALATAVACVAAWLAVLGPGAGPRDDFRQASTLQETPDASALADASLLTEEWTAQLPAMVSEAVAAPQWAYLDHDAQLAMETFVDHLPLDWAE